MRVDTVGRMSLSRVQKCIYVIHVLSYGMSAGNIYDNVRIGESTTLECLERFAISVYIWGKVSKKAYKWIHTSGTNGRCKTQGFLGMLGSINCMH